MKIAFIQNVTVTDHRMVHTDGIARCLANEGHEVDAIIQKSNNKSQFEAPNYNVIQLKGDTYSIKGQLRFAYELFKHLYSKRYDVIHAKNPFSSVIAPILVRSTGMKFTLIYDVRGLWVDFLEEVRGRKSPLNPLLKRFDILCMNLCDGVIAISDELARVLIKRGANSKKLRVIEGDGTETSKIRDLKPIDLTFSLGLNPPILGYVGSIGRGRNSHKIIEAFKHVVEEVQDVKLVMIGPICGRGRIINLVKEMELTHKIYFMGYLESHDDVLRHCKSFTTALAYHDINLPCFNVMVPTKVLEYLACGCPIVATDHKAHTNMLRHGFNAILTRQDPHNYAQGIVTLLKDHQLATRISSNALESVKKYDYKTIAGRILEFYGACMNT